MFPLLPVDLLEEHESVKTDDDSLFTVNKMQNNQKPVLVVEELPPKVHDIKYVKKSPVIDIIHSDIHVIGMIS